MRVKRAFCVKRSESKREWHSILGKYVCLRVRQKGKCKITASDAVTVSKRVAAGIS